MTVPILETERLLVRPFALDDLEPFHRIKAAAGWAGGDDLAADRAWLDWTVRGYDQAARLHQPPYGDRAVVLRADGRLVGGCGLVPLLMPFGQLPAFGGRAGSPYRTEMGLFWIVDPAEQGQGLATEAAAALVRYAFDRLRLHRLVATTEHTNLASAGVMRRLGMNIERNPFPDPPWMQVVGILPNPVFSPTTEHEQGGVP